MNMHELFVRECARDQRLAAGFWRDARVAYVAGDLKAAQFEQARCARLYAQARAGYELAGEAS